uniref:Glycosyl transferase family 1 domain-containing protein n=1 Tax=Brassica campestris TaxID=3711 RepID=M4C9S0_BRACM
MGSLESGIPAKREPAAARWGRQHPFLQRNRSRLSRFFLFKKLNYIQLICTMCVFFFFVVLFQMFLPGLVVVVDKSDKPPWRSKKKELLPPDLVVFEESGVFDFGEGVRLEPTKLLMKFRRDATQTSTSDGFNLTTNTQRFGFRKPKLALVFADLLADAEQMKMVTVSNALLEIGYAIEVYSLEDGPVHGVWQQMGVSVTILEANHASSCVIDWLSYDGVIVNSLEARSVFACFMQEPFKSLPLVWVINEKTLAVRSRQYNSTGHTELLTDWKKIFSRASVVVFHDYLLPILYSEFDAGNFYVIPGSPEEVWKAKTLDFPRKDDIVISIVGSQFLYKGQCLEHALLLQALRPLFSGYNTESYNSHLKIIVLGGESASNYSVAIETISQNLTYPNDAVKHVSVAGSVDKILESSDLVIYGSFLEEQSFPEILMKAMALGKPIVAPDLLNIKKHVDDRVTGYLFPKKNLEILLQIVLEVITEGKISPLARNIGLMGKSIVKNMMALETIEGYAVLLENILKLSSEVASPKDIQTVPPKLREGWSWHLFEALMNASPDNRTARSYEFIANVEGHWNHTSGEATTKFGVVNDDSFVYEIWEDERYLQVINSKKRQEDEELKGRALQYHGTWEDVYKNAKRADRSKNDLHERDEGELLRTGQPLCIYEPYFGEGTWSFLHQYPLYRGVGMSGKGRRPRMDDIDASSRLPLFNNPYYRDAIGDFGAFFAISNKIDRLHKNSWIGFQSWRATARKESLSRIAENALLNAIKTRKHGDALYFWVRMDKDPRNPLQKSFWSFCDSINAGNCRFAYNETLKKMYSVKNIDSLPPMPEDGDTWSVMQSWALPTRSFLEFVMFSRMFVDSLDAQVYEEHHRTNRCYLSLTKDKHCYSRLLELLVNVWAYHSARRIVYIDPGTGVMQEQHIQKDRRGQMWVQWFEYTTLKTMDEDLAEEADSDRRVGHWIWPWTGEVVWRGSLEKERQRKNVEKEEKKKRSKDKLNRMRNRNSRQKVIGKYVKPPPDNETVTGNSTL